MMRRAPTLRRIAFSALVLLTLSGPSPGAVGSCGGDELDEPADLQTYCRERDQLICVRRALRKEISDAERDECRRDALIDCDHRSFAPGCEPTERQARACLGALRSLDTLSTPEDQLEECDPEALCGGLADAEEEQ
jgi:hypothetical protein